MARPKFPFPGGPPPSLDEPTRPAALRGTPPSRGITISPRTKRLVIGGAAGALALTLGYALLRDRKPEERAAPRVVVRPVPRMRRDENDRGEYERRRARRDDDDRREKRRKRKKRHRDDNDRGVYGRRRRHDEERDDD